MAFAKNLATSFVLATAAATYTGDALAHNVPPVTPPSINAKSDKDRIPVLMIKLYDLNSEKFTKKLEVGQVRPKKKFTTEKTEIYDEIKDAAERKKLSQEFGLDDTKVKKITVKGDGIMNTYYFLGDEDKVHATATSTQLELEKPADDKDNLTQRVFWTTHIPEAQRVVFGYKEVSPAEKKATKWNTIEVSYDPRKDAFLTTHKSTTHAPEELESHSVASVEKQLSVITRSGMSPSR